MKFPFWRGAVRGEVFREVCHEVFHEVFGLVLLGHSEQKNFSKNFSPKFPWPCTAKLEKFQGKNFMTRFCRGTLANIFLAIAMTKQIAHKTCHDKIGNVTVNPRSDAIRWPHDPASSSAVLSAPSPGDDLRPKSAIRLRSQIVRSDSFWEIGCDFSVVTIRLRLRCILR